MVRSRKRTANSDFRKSCSEAGSGGGGAPLEEEELVIGDEPQRSQGYRQDLGRTLTRIKAANDGRCKKDEGKGEERGKESPKHFIKVRHFPLRLQGESTGAPAMYASCTGYSWSWPYNPLPLSVATHESMVCRRDVPSPQPCNETLPKPTRDLRVLMQHALQHLHINSSSIHP